MHMSPLVGSPLYMSPEQMRAMPVDARADIWGLGAVMFECVAGQPAFAASTVSEIRAKVLSEPLPDLRRLNLEVPEEFVCVVERCLKRNPAFRFQNVAELALALEPLAIPSSGSPSERIACLLGIEPTKLIIRNPANELTLDRIDTGKPVSGRTSGIRSHWLLGVSVVLSIAIALGYSSHKYPQKMTWLVAEARHQATSLLGAASR
jgi:serine/threonine-protein kinase